ncbi:helix-turn-helix domain-containing protein [Streptomyces rochei]|jgi:transcriptional regulator with XRE-family HTH domain|uniref:Helix-turn-helix domain-containing protein n=3 Tax=Streptomyces rochei group TaxID=2867164 RepID=A0AAX3ZDG2_STRRO|nr:MULTISPECIES: helix-turn-helix transcriptional regulator [Streptomyces]MBJ6618520.1 helix-turn-helix domain-containing protein [Streptomyces sp. DHE17-7]MBQ0916257.1 helix-turn-helix domain-containing protein [Streptomyces sp. RM99]MBU8548421.1 helix-turn-helix domain-containing protein [Streptomyces sp. Osf17]MBU8555196.1 helix-turn-helix domain-containing protein [Streptomyces sp. Babs14]MBX4178681.1 helix-turn-helix domain-containing protein [Streptomyces geysiriensis]
MQHGPVVRRRKLGAELRALRTSAGITSGEAARLVGWHQSKVSRIETGTSGAKPADVRLLLDAYGVDDAQLRELLEVLAGTDGPGGGRNHWWHAYRGVLPPTYRDFISLESQASAMRTLETTVVPGLLQTPEYARAVTHAAVDGLSEERLDTLVEVRLARQDVLRAEPPLELSAVLDEAVLRREVGGPGVMARQLERLVEAARLPHVALRVLPFAAGAHIGVTGPFVIFSFSSTSDLDVVVLDHLTSSLHLERKEDVEAYTEAFNALLVHALSPEDSLDFIAATAAGA